jgi:small subunit ribosomal protein S2
MQELPTIEQMLKSGMHFGHRTSKWHPKMAPYIFGERNGIHIIDLVKARQAMSGALDFMSKFAAESKSILLVGTKIQVKQSIRQTADKHSFPYVTEKWLGGCLTNFGNIRQLVRKYEKLLSEKEAGKYSRFTKKERLDIDRTIEKLEMKVGGLRNMTRLPDALFIWDIKNEKIAVEEARKKNIPIIAVCDTNADPTLINYPIPANDDATKTIKLIMSAVDEAITAGKAAKGREKAAPDKK